MHMYVRKSLCIAAIIDLSKSIPVIHLNGPVVNVSSHLPYMHMNVQIFQSYKFVVNIHEYNGSVVRTVFWYVYIVVAGCRLHAEGFICQL